MFKNEFAHHPKSQPDGWCLPLVLLMLGAVAAVVAALVLAVSS